jgi:hypothetical protein
LSEDGLEVVDHVVYWMQFFACQDDYQLLITKDPRLIAAAIKSPTDPNPKKIVTGITHSAGDLVSNAFPVRKPIHPKTRIAEKIINICASFIN